MRGLGPNFAFIVKPNRWWAFSLLNKCRADDVRDALTFVRSRTPRWCWHFFSYLLKVIITLQDETVTIGTKVSSSTQSTTSWKNLTANIIIYYRGDCIYCVVCAFLQYFQPPEHFRRIINIIPANITNVNVLTIIWLGLGLKLQLSVQISKIQSPNH